MATVAAVTTSRVRGRQGYGEAAHPVTVPTSSGGPVCPRMSELFIRRGFVLILSVLCLILLMGLSGCNGNSQAGGSPSEEIPGVPAAGEPPDEIPGVEAPGAPAPGAPEEIPGVSDQGAPPDEIPGVDSSGSAPPPDGEEIPGVSPQPTPPMPTSLSGPQTPSQSWPAQAQELVTEAVNVERTEILADQPPDANARLNFLDSLPSYPPEKVTALKNYEWVSSTAAAKFDKALEWVADG
jgi:hypothetical protein